MNDNRLQKYHSYFHNSWYVLFCSSNILDNSMEMCEQKLNKFEGKIMALAQILRTKFGISVVGDLLGLFAIVAMLLPWLAFSLVY